MSLVIPPGSTIGILGGGQLGRMTALAAANLGYRCRIYSPDADSPAAAVAESWTSAAWDDEAALRSFAAQVDVVTYEFENVPVRTATFLAALKPVRPGPQALDVAQHRAREKEFLASIGIATPGWSPVRSEGELSDAARRIGLPAILKTARDGYDGKGQVRLREAKDVSGAWHAIGGRESVLEALVPFASEMSVITARGLDGEVRSFPPGTNLHSDGILATTSVPASVSDAVRNAAIDCGARLATSLEIVGLIALELFVTADGRVLANEMAPRPHNSGHWTMDACRTSQFEQLVRAVCGLPLGAVDLLTPVVMENLIGSSIERWPAIVADPNAKLHLYGKAEVRRGRKMGHVNWLGSSP